jgi:N-ATPase, AtpR subunit
MNWLVALTLGVGVGLAYFAGLWLTLRASLPNPAAAGPVGIRHHGGGRMLLGASYFARFALVAVVFAALSREGLGHVLLGLAGLLLARHWLIGQIGGIGHDN